MKLYYKPTTRTVEILHNLHATESPQDPLPGVRFVGRPVVLNCSSLLERVSELIDFYLLPVVKSQPTNLKDTRDTIRKVKNIQLPHSTSK